MRCRYLTTVAVEQGCSIKSGRRFNTPVCSSSSSCLPVGSVTNSAALFKKFQLTAGKPKGGAAFHLPLSRACSPARSDLLEVKGGLHTNSLRAWRSIPESDCFVKYVKPQLGSMPPHFFFISSCDDLHKFVQCRGHQTMLGCLKDTCAAAL